MTRRLGQGLTPLLLVGVVLTMIIPLPPGLLDVLLAANISLAVIVLLGALLVTDTLDLSVFPSLLLVTTLLRLALNVSSTRLILLDGYAGKVIDTFGGFVIGGQVVVGLVVFIILVVIQFVVITNGAGRVAEVAARFTLDAMPGKQMAIDADLGAGVIDDATARTLRARISQEADFYGAMDGASKFVKGDAIASIIITAVNLVGGLTIGLVSKGMDLGEAVDTYSRLSVGDGLVSQIPALLLSLATGILVTRVGSTDSTGAALTTQLLANTAALRLGAGVVAGIGLLPGLPKIPFLSLSGLLWVAAMRTAGPPPSESPPAEVAIRPDDPEAILESVRVDPLELHLAPDITDLVDHSGDLMERVRALRRQLADELGVVIPLLRVRDDASLPPSTYELLLRGVVVGHGLAPPGRLLALPAGDGSELAGLGGDMTVEPVFHLDAYWIPAEARTAAATAGATVVDRSAAVVTHLAEIARRNASQLLGRQDVQVLLEGLRYDEPLLANEVGTERLPLSLFHAVLRGLLDDGVSIRDIARIVEAVSLKAAESRSVDLLVAAARVAVGGAIVGRLAPSGRLRVVTLDPALEASYLETVRELDGVPHLVLDPARLERLGREAAAALRDAGDDPVAIVCSQALRKPLTRTLGSLDVPLPVVAYPEIPPHIELIPSGVIEYADPVRA